MTIRIGLGIGLETSAGALNPYDFASPYFDRSLLTSATTTLGTEFDTAGLLRYAPHNMFTYSEQFDNAVFTKTRSSISANAAVAPDGTTTADKLLETADSGTHKASHAFTTIAGLVYTGSIYMKAAERTWGCLNATGVSGSQVTFDLENGVVGTIGWGANSASIEDVGNGWYRCSMTFTASTTANNIEPLTATGTSTFSYAGDVTKGIYIWGAQLEQNPSARTYHATTSAAWYGPRKHVVYDGDQWPEMNLFTYSEQFDNAAWGKVSSTVSVDAAIAPDGTTTAEKFIPNNSASTAYIKRSSLPASTGTYTASIYAKAAELTALRMDLHSNEDGSTSSVFNLSDGTVTSGSGVIESVGNGWYRCSQTKTWTGLTNAQCQMARNTVTGDGSSGFYIWGAQLENAETGQTTPGTYHVTTTAAYYGAIPNSPWLDKGLLVEGSTQYERIGNQDLSGAGWANVSGSVGVTTGTDLDGSTQSIVLTDDSASTAELMGSTTRTIANDGATHCCHMRVPVTAGATHFPVLGFWLQGGTTEAANFILNTDTGVLTRWSTGTGTGTATREGDNWRVFLTCVNNSTGNVTARIYLYPAGSINGTTQVNSAQGSTKFMGAGIILNQSFDVSPLYVDYASSGATTRSADKISIATSSIPGFSATEGTLLAAFTSAPVSLNYPQPFAISDGSPSNRIEVYLAASGANYNSTFRVSDGGVTQVSDGYAGTFTPGAAAKIAVAWKTNDFAHSRNGGAAEGDTSGTVPTGLTAIYLGANSTGSASFLSGSIQSITYSTTRLSDAAIQALTA